MSKLLLALQFYAGDKAAALDLARLIADIESSHSEAADFLFVARWDCDFDADVIAHVSRKFNVRTFRTRQRGKFWPFGPNCVWHDVMAHAFEQRREGRFPYKAILTFEADCVPLSRDWISRLSAEFDSRHVKVLGCEQPHPIKHINGNALFSCDQDFLKSLRKLGNCSPAIGWDVAHAKRFFQWGAADTPLIRSWYSRPTVAEEALDSLAASGACFLHGIKDDSARRWAWRRLV